MNLRWFTFFVSFTALCALAPIPVFGGDCSITEGPDTVGSGREAASQSLGCLPDEDGNSDVDVAYEPLRGWPVVVCSRTAGSDRDVAFDEWREDGWLPQPVFLTSSVLDEVDPRLHVDDAGNVYVVWWENSDPQSVLLVRRPAGSEVWDRPLLVTSSGRRPSITSWNGTVRVAFERDADGGVQELVVATEGALGFSSEVVTAVAGTEPLDARLLASDGHVWLSWTTARGDRVASELRGEKWMAPRPASWISATPVAELSSP